METCCFNSQPVSPLAVSTSSLSSSSQALFASPAWRNCRQACLLQRCHSKSARGLAQPRAVAQRDEPEHELAAPLDRRQLLLASAGSMGLAGMGLPSLLVPGTALASPVQPPDFKKCTTPLDPGNGAPSVDCCLPVSTTITDYKIPNLPMRTRVSAHQATPEYIAKYTEAYRRLRSLPSSDPRAYMMQANVHCAFCDNAYDENGTAVDYQVHNSWFFFPWHRWYLYFHERILASLIGDDTFALPFWNWDAPGGYTIPPMFDNPNSTLYDTKRNPLHRNPKVVDLDYFSESNRTPQQQLQVNNSVMYRQMVTAAKTPSLFFGQSYRQGDSPGPGAGTVENTPHGTVHVWTGNPSNPNDEDMGTLYSAARDPIFFAHHGNVDRLWSIWKTLGGRRTDLTDSDYLQATFEFYDENKNLVRVKIADALQTENLRYNYQNVDIPWVRRTTTRSAVATTFSGPGGGPPPAMAGPLKEKIKEKYRDFKKGLKEFKADLKDKMAGRKLEKTLKALVKRPRKVKAADFDEEILVIEGVQVACDEKVKFDVYINLVDVDEDKVGNDVVEYAGSFVNVPHTAMKMAETKKGLTDSRIRKSNFRLGIGDVLADLDIEDDDDFAVTIVPRGKPNIPVSIDDIRLEYE